LFDLGPVGVYSCDARGAIQEFNRSAVELWGRKPRLGDRSERFCGSRALYLPGGRRLPHAQCPMAQVLDGRVPSVRDREVVMERPDGSRITVIVNIVRLGNEQGETTGAINCFYDITERKRSEEALRETRAQLARHAGQLEKLVAHRTAELTATNRRLEASIDVIRKTQEGYRVLLLESQGMQRKLRDLTHQIITAQEDERKEISRELHDEVVQTLVGISVELSMLGRKPSATAHDLGPKLAHIQRLVAKSVSTVHGFARELRPAVLDDLGLIPALHAFSKNLAERRKLRIRITAFGGVEALDGAKRTALFRVAQEALTNIARHARATQVKMNISRAAGAIRMEISDNGKSFPVAQVLLEKNPKRLGLVGMKERIEMVGGKLVILSERGRGTIVRAEIPFIPEKRKK
jgi:PAS domain S-box-containing protein